MTPRRPGSGDRQPDFTPAQIDALTTHAEELLDELQDVMARLADRLEVLGKGG